MLIRAHTTGGNTLDVVERAEFGKVARLHRNEVGEDVLPRQSEVLDDEVELVVGVLDARDGDVANLDKSQRRNRTTARKYEPAPQASEG